MSTLAAARADNMYYPPEWRPEMGGISKFQGSKGHNQYEQYGKIRFELPVHGWCLGCGRHIGRGTRFNATKDQAGMYYSTKIWQFSMKCPSCSTLLVIKTDPKNTDYEYVEGIRKKDMAFDPEEAQTERVQDSEVSNKLAVDPLYRLEHEQADKRRAASRKTVLTRLTELADAHGQDDYSANARLRKGMRLRKRKDREREEEEKARGLGVRLATPIPADGEAAQRVKYRNRHKGFRTGEKAKMAAITTESIFGSGNESSAQVRRKAVLTKAAKLGIKTRGMRLLVPETNELSPAPQGPPAQRVGVFGGSQHGFSLDLNRTGAERKGRKKRMSDVELEHRGSKSPCVADDNRDPSAFEGDKLDRGHEDDSASLSNSSAVVRRGKHEAIQSVTKKKRKGSPSSRARAAVTTGNAGGLAAIASLY